MDLSVVIVTRNTRTFTCDAIQSVLDSDDPFEKEIIIVDNGSSDGTGEEVLKRFPGVIYLWSEWNLGFARADNIGAEKASGDFILLLNSDARLKPDSLAKAVGWMRANPKCGVAGAQLLNPDGSRQNSIANFPSLATELLNKSLLRRLFPNRYPGKEQQFASPTEVDTVIGAFFLVPRTVWNAIGGFDERYFFFFEETDFCLQARRRGYRVMHLPDVEVWHEQGKSAGQRNTDARLEYWRSRFSYFRKNHPGWSVLLLRLGLSVRLVIEFLASLLVNLFTLGQISKFRKKLTTYWVLLSWNLRGCPASEGLPR